jgi:hypothetical protein
MVTVEIKSVKLDSSNIASVELINLSLIRLYKTLLNYDRRTTFKKFSKSEKY